MMNKSTCSFLRIKTTIVLPSVVLSPLSTDNTFFLAFDTFVFVRFRHPWAPETYDAVRLRVGTDLVYRPERIPIFHPSIGEGPCLSFRNHMYRLVVYRSERLVAPPVHPMETHEVCPSKGLVLWVHLFWPVSICEDCSAWRAFWLRLCKTHPMWLLHT